MSKIQNEGEVLRWFTEGRTYAWMIEEYRRRYSVETTTSMWGNYRRRRGLDRRTAWDTELIPWAIKPHHRYLNPILMLRKEARRRAGFEAEPERHHEIDAWLRGMAENGTVVHYEPETTEGWSYVARRVGIDLDIIREPGSRTGKRRSN